MDKQKEPRLRFKGFTGNWEENVLEEVVNFFSGLTYSPNDVVKNGTLVLRSSNVQDNQITTEDNVFVKESAVNCQNVEVGDVIVVVRNGSRSLIGKHAIIKEKMPNTVIGAFMTGVRSNQPDFLNALLDSYKFNQEIEKNLGATINQITTGAFRKMEFSLPSLPEQTHLGLFFRHLDSQIAESRAVLEKSRQLKKAMLAKMFPANGEKIPKIRFKGFEGEWESRKLGEIGSTFGGLTNKSREDFGHGDARYITYMNVYQNALSSEHQLDSIEIDVKQNEVKKGDVLFTTSSETPEEVGMSSVWAFDINNVYLNSFCFGYRLNKQINLNYLAYCLRSDYIRSQMILLAQGISRYNISKKGVMEIEILIPTAEEQTAIGNFFRQLDETIALQSAEVEKLNQLKKGLLAAMLV